MKLGGKTLSWKRVSRWSALVLGVVLLLGFLTTIAVSRVPMRGAEVFGAMANKIKGNPGATAYGTLAAITLLWISIGALAAVQEWLAARRRAP
jgi:hypothetical protein